MKYIRLKFIQTLLAIKANLNFNLNQIKQNFQCCHPTYGNDNENLSTKFYTLSPLRS